MGETGPKHRCSNRARVAVTLEKRGSPASYGLQACQLLGQRSVVGEMMPGWVPGVRGDQSEAQGTLIRVRSTQSSVLLRTGGHRRAVSGVTHIVCQDKTTTEQLGKWLRR